MEAQSRSSELARADDAAGGSPLSISGEEVEELLRTCTPTSKDIRTSDPVRRSPTTCSSCSSPSCAVDRGLHRRSQALARSQEQASPTLVEALAQFVRDDIAVAMIGHEGTEVLPVPRHGLLLHPHEQHPRPDSGLQAGYRHDGRHRRALDHRLHLLQRRRASRSRASGATSRASRPRACRSRST